MATALRLDRLPSHVPRTFDLIISLVLLQQWRSLCSLLPTRDGRRGLTAKETLHDAWQSNQDGITAVPCSQWRRAREKGHIDKCKRSARLRGTERAGKAQDAAKPYGGAVASTCLITIAFAQVGPWC